MEGSLRDMPFRRLVREDPELAELRREYAAKPADHRRKAALFNYDASIAEEMFGEAILRSTGESDWLSKEEPGTGGVVALAIDPLCAPAMLTVGSVEYQLRRPEEAMVHFLALTGLPADTKELPEIIDKAGDFLLDQDDYARAEALYGEAARQHPDVALYHDALGYCVGKLGDLQAAVRHSRRAVELAPENHDFLSNLGWALVEVESYDEAEEVLERAADLAPEDYHWARNNLEECRRRRAGLGEK